MNNLQLPDEIIRKIYQYVHPAFEYQSYIHALKKYDDENQALAGIVNTFDNVGSIDDRIGFNEALAAYACLLNEYLFDIQTFLKENPKFTRPDFGNNLTEYRCRYAWEWEYDKNQLSRVEKNIWRRRRRIEFDRHGGGAIVHHDIVYMLRHGTIEDLKWCCRVNRIVCDCDKNDKKLYRNHMVTKLLRL